MAYFYETHLHTCEASACGVTPGKEYIKAYIDIGYDGIFVTDHFFNGNSCVPVNLPWEERIDLYARGFEAAAEEGYKYNFKVFFGMEVNFHGDEYLIYGPTKEWLKANPDIMRWSHDELRIKVHEAGGVMVQAHPFRDRGYLSGVYVHPYQSDLFEGYNLGNSDYSDQYVFTFAKRNGILMTSGSDIHNVKNIEKNRGGVGFTTPLESAKDYAKRLLSAKESIPLVRDDIEQYNESILKLNDSNYGFITYRDRMNADTKNTVFNSPLFIADRQDKIVPYTKDNVLEVRL